MPDKDDAHLKNWKILSSQILYDYQPYLRLEKQNIALPDGRQIDDYHQLFMPQYCVVCAITRDNEIVLLRGYRHGIGEISPFLPGGLVTEGESPLTGAKRELLEETGYCATNWRAMGSYVPHANYGCGRVYLFLGQNAWRECAPDSGDLESMIVEVVDMTEVLDWVRKGCFQSLSSVTAVTLAALDIVQSNSHPSFDEAN